MTPPQPPEPVGAESEEKPGWWHVPGAEFCDAKHEVAHETFGCLRPVGHAPPHRAYVADPPCPYCDGLDQHSDECPHPELTTTEARDLEWSA